MNKNLLYILIGTTVPVGAAALYGVGVLLSMLFGAQTMLTISFWILSSMLAVGILWVLGFCVYASAEYRSNKSAREEYRKRKYGL